MEIKPSFSNKTYPKYYLKNIYISKNKLFNLNKTLLS